jgi:hypothetical protein
MNSGGTNRVPQDRGPLYTLDQIGERTGIHPMLLQSYLQTAAWRVPTVWVAGEERYPREALVAFRELHQEAQEASAPVAPPAGDGPSWGRRRLMSITAQRRAGARAADAAANGNGGSARATAAAREDETADQAAEAARRAAADESALEPEPEHETAAAHAAAAADDEPRRPPRTLYTLQQVHDITGIPYTALAFYAASEASHIPAAGERYAPLYPWEALHVFCRIHHERNPSWQPPSLPTVPPAPEDEAAARELSSRLERLEHAQSVLAEQIRRLLDEDESYVTATVWA